MRSSLSFLGGLLSAYEITVSMGIPRSIIKRSMVVESFLWKSFHTVLRCLFDMTRAVGFGVNSQIEIHRIGDSTACR